MIPARMGSQRLKHKNLQLINGISLLEHAINRCKIANVFDSIWVNSESDQLGEIATTKGVNFYKRNEELANNVATSEDFVADFLYNNDCDFLVQVHSIAPLLTPSLIQNFVGNLSEKFDTYLSCEQIQIECSLADKPLNFTYKKKENSQDLLPVQRISWSISAWNKKTFLSAFESGDCATYSGKVSYFKVDSFSSLVIKTEVDLRTANALFPLVY